METIVTILSKQATQSALKDAALLQPAQLAVVIQSDIYHRRQSGEVVDLKQILESFPDVSSSPELVSRLAEFDYLHRRDRGDAPAQEEYPQKFELDPEGANSFTRSDMGVVTLTINMAEHLDEAATIAMAAGTSCSDTLFELPDIPGYEVVSVLGRGGMGQVLKARDKTLDRWVAIKMPLHDIHVHPEYGERFMREARASARLRHPGICPIHDVSEHEGRPYLVMDYIEGLPLGRWAADAEPSARTIAELVCDIASALHYAHEEHIIHRDIKPSNIHIDARTGKPVIMDFGLAKDISDETTELTLSGQVLGTPYYMAPEQAAGDQERIGAAADQYALGVVLYELLSGQRPFEGTLTQLLYSVRHEEPIPLRKLNTRLHADLETICMKAMAKEPERRYNTTGDMAEDLRRFIEGEAIQARRMSIAELLIRKARRNPRLMTISAIAIVALLAGTVALQKGIRQSEVNREVTELQGLFDAVDWGTASLDVWEPNLADLTVKAPGEAQRLRDQMHRGFVEAIRQDIQQSDINDARWRALDQRCRQLSAHRPEFAEQVLQELDARRRVWEPLFELTAPFENHTEVFDLKSSELHIEGDHILSERFYMPTRIPSPRLVELEAEFSRPALSGGWDLALELDAFERGGYEFVLTAPRDEGGVVSEEPTVQQIPVQADSGTPGIGWSNWSKAEAEVRKDNGRTILRITDQSVQKKSILTYRMPITAGSYATITAAIHFKTIDVSSRGQNAEIGIGFHDVDGKSLKGGGYQHHAGNAEGLTALEITKPVPRNARSVSFSIGVGKAQTGIVDFSHLDVTRTPRYPVDFHTNLSPDNEPVALLRIYRHHQLLRVSSIPIAVVQADTIQLKARREGNRLEFQVGTHEPLVLEEIFAVEPRSARPFALAAPPGTKLFRLQARRQSVPVERTLVEQGNADFLAENYSSALGKFRQATAESSREDVRQESQFKAAVCLLALRQNTEAVSTLENLMNESGDRWPLLAGAELWKYFLTFQKFDRADQVYQMLTLRYGVRTFSATLPINQLEDIYRILMKRRSLDELLGFVNEGKVTHAENLMEAIDDFYLPIAARMEAENAYLHLLELSDNHEGARAFSRKRLDAYKSLKERYLFKSINATVSLYMSSMYRLGRGAEALPELDYWIEEAKSNAQETLWIYRHRGNLHSGLGQYESAIKDLNHSIETIRESFAGQRMWLVQNLGSLATAYSLSGDPIMAQKLWDEAYELAKEEGDLRHDGKISRYNFNHMVLTWIVGSLSTSQTPAELAAVRDAFLSMITRGVASDKAQMLNAVSSKLLEMPDTLVREMWRSPPGRLLAHDINQGLLNYREVARRFAVLFITNMLVYETLEPDAVTPDHFIAARGLSEPLINDFWAQEMDAMHASLLVIMWTGVHNDMSWKPLTATLTPETSAHLAYFAGLRFRKLDREEEAVAFFKEALASEAVPPLIEKLAREALTTTE